LNDANSLVKHRVDELVHVYNVEEWEWSDEDVIAVTPFVSSKRPVASWPSQRSSVLSLHAMEGGCKGKATDKNETMAVATSCLRHSLIASLAALHAPNSFALGF
jgi:hypothetical protein